MGRVALGILVTGFVVSLWPGTAWACSPAPCTLGELVPGPGSTVPENLRGIEWIRARGDGLTVTAARLWRHR